MARRVYPMVCPWCLVEYKHDPHRKYSQDVCPACEPEMEEAVRELMRQYPMRKRKKGAGLLGFGVLR